MEAYEPDVDPLLPPDEGGPPDPDGGAPLPPLDALPMFGQFLVELEPEFELEPDPEPVDELEDPVAVPPEPVLPVFELDNGAGEELELEPELPVVVDVVAALATSAPPATRPDVNAPTARTLRSRICMAVVPFRLCGAPARSSRYCTRCAPDLSATAE